MRSIRLRLLAGTVAGVAVTFTIAGVLVFALTWSRMHAQFDDALVNRARALSALIEQDGDNIETDLGREESGAEFHQLWHASGKTLRKSASLGDKELGRREAGVEDVALPDGRAGKQATIEFQPALDEDSPPGTAQVTLRFAVAKDTADLDATITALGRVLVLVGICATMLAALLMMIAVRYGLQPVRDLAGSIAELKGTAARLDATKSPEELQPVVRRLNELLARVEGAFARERELTGDVAHELRTPISGLRATIELALDRERTPERYKQALADCLAICVQTERMLESLLSLARLDAGMVKLTRAPIAFDELVRSALAGHARRAEQRKLVIETELAPTKLDTDGEKLRVVVDNLIDNAVSYADEGGTIRVVLGDTLEISNTGCTLESVDRVFDRFWRGDQARSAGAHGGIGLALCKKLVDLLGGTLEARVADGKFIVVLSATSEPGVDRSGAEP